MNFNDFQSRNQKIHTITPTTAPDPDNIVDLTTTSIQQLLKHFVWSLPIKLFISYMKNDNVCIPTQIVWNIILWNYVCHKSISKAMVAKFLDQSTVIWILYDLIHETICAPYHGPNLNWCQCLFSSMDGKIDFTLYTRSHMTAGITF